MTSDGRHLSSPLRGNGRTVPLELVPVAFALVIFCKGVSASSNSFGWLDLTETHIANPALVLLLPRIRIFYESDEEDVLLSGMRRTNLFDVFWRERFEVGPFFAGPNRRLSHLPGPAIGEALHRFVRSKVRINRDGDYRHADAGSVSRCKAKILQLINQSITQAPSWGWGIAWSAPAVWAENLQHMPIGPFAPMESNIGPQLLPLHIFGDIQRLNRVAVLPVRLRLCVDALLSHFTKLFVKDPVGQECKAGGNDQQANLRYIKAISFLALGALFAARSVYLVSYFVRKISEKGG